MKTRILILLIACGILVSFGATRIGKKHSKKVEVLAESKTTAAAPIGGLGVEDH